MKKNTKNIYWIEKDQKEAIKKFKSAKNDDERNRIWIDKLEYPFFRLAEAVYKRNKIAYYPFEEAIVDIKSHFIHAIDHYKSTKGNSFGYFGTVARNFFVAESNRRYKYNLLHESFIFESEDGDKERFDIADDKIETSTKRTEIMRFLQLAIKWWEKNVDKFAGNGLFKKNRKKRILKVIKLMNDELTGNHIFQQMDCKMCKVEKFYNIFIRQNRQLYKDYCEYGDLSKSSIVLLRPNKQKQKDNYKLRQVALNEAKEKFEIDFAENLKSKKPMPKLWLARQIALSVGAKYKVVLSSYTISASICAKRWKQQ